MRQFRSSGLYGIIGSLLAILLSLGMIHFVSLSTSTLMQRTLVDLGHAPAFALIAYAIHGSVRSYRHNRSQSLRSLDFVMVGLAIFLLAGMSEIAQLAVAGRSASATDLLRNCGGGAIVLLVMAALSPPVSGFAPTTVKRMCIGLTGVVAIVLLAPTAWAVAAYANRNAHWPLVIGGCHFLDRALTVGYQSKLNTVSVPIKWRKRHSNSDEAFLVRLIAEDNSGILVQELARDWSGFDELCIEITNPGKRPLKASVSFGTQNMFFRSNSFHETQMLFSADSRATQCVNLSYSKEYRSLAILSAEENEAQEFLLHRVWFR